MSITVIAFGVNAKGDIDALLRDRIMRVYTNSETKLEGAPRVT